MMIVDVYLTIVIILGTNDRRSITDDLAVEGNILRSHDSSRYHEVGAKLLFTRQRWLELRDMKHLQKSQDKWVAIDPIFLVIWGWPSVHPSSDGKSIVPMLDPSAVRILRRYRDCQTLVPSFLPSWLFHSLRIILEYLSLGVGHSNMEVCWITVKTAEEWVAKLSEENTHTYCKKSPSVGRIKIEQGASVADTKGHGTCRGPDNRLDVSSSIVSPQMGHVSGISRQKIRLAASQWEK